VDLRCAADSIPVQVVGTSPVCYTNVTELPRPCVLRSRVRSAYGKLTTRNRLRSAVCRRKPSCEVVLVNTVSFTERSVSQEAVECGRTGEHAVVVYGAQCGHTS
jgi:hypothetical protein